MLTSTPVLGALKAEKPAHPDKEVIQRNHFHERDAAQASKKFDSHNKAAADSSAASEAKQSGDSTGPLGKRARKEGCDRRPGRLETDHEGWLHDAAEDRKCRHCSGQAISLAAASIS